MVDSGVETGEPGFLRDARRRGEVELEPAPFPLPDGPNWRVSLLRMFGSVSAFRSALGRFLESLEQCG